MTDPQQITSYLYEEDGELSVYRCPVCGSVGESGSWCPHEPPTAAFEQDGAKRVRVRIPQVEEEPRYTLEQVAALVKEQIGRIRDRESSCRLKPQLHETRAEKAKRLGKAWGLDNAAAGLEGFLDHFTQQPVGVGADPLGKSHGVGTSSTSSVSADSDGNDQPLGGDDRCQENQLGRDVAQGGSGQGAASAPFNAEERRLLEVARTVMDLSRHSLPPHISEADHGRAYLLLSILIERAQQPSDGQEGGVEEGADRG